MHCHQAHSREIVNKISPLYYVPVEDPVYSKIQGIFERRAQSLGGQTMKTVTDDQHSIVTEESNVGDFKSNHVL